MLFSAHYGLAGSEEKTELMLLKGSDGKWKSTIEGLTAGNYEVVVKGTDGSSYPESPINFNVTIENQPYEVSYDETTHDVIVNIAILNFTVVGDDRILNGVSWNEASVINRMTSTDGVTYTLEVKNAELTAGNYQYIVCKDGNWSVTYPASNATLTIPANGTYDITYTYKVGDDEPSAVATMSEGGNTGEEGDNTGEEGNGDPVPTEGITIYVKGAEAPYIYAWVEDESGNRINPAGSFPGTQMTKWTVINGKKFWFYNITGYDSFSYILNNGKIGNFSDLKQTSDLSADGDRYHGEGTSWTDITDQMIPAYTDITLAANSGSTDYWGTYSNMGSAAQLSAVDGTSLKVYDAKVSGGVLTLTERTSCDVAKGEGVLVWSNGANVRATAITDKLTATVNTDLVATPSVAKTITADAGYKLYRLTYNDVESKTGLGFYLGLVKDENSKVDETSLGKKLKATPGKAYLEVTTEAATKPSNAAPARGFVFPGDDETTGIGEIVIDGDAGISGSANANDRIYNLQGQQVTAPVKGLYIKNNKKVVIK